MKVYCEFSLELPQRSNSNEYTQYTILNMKKNHSKLSHICNYGICSKGLKQKFETAVVNEPSVFEPLKFYSINIQSRSNYRKTPINEHKTTTATTLKERISQIDYVFEDKLTKY